MIGIGLGVGVATVPATAASGINPNLLTWTEQFDNAAWVKTNATVIPNAGTDPLGGSTADQIANTGSGRLEQTLGVAAVDIGATGTLDITVTSTWTRYSVTTEYDIGFRTFSIWLIDPLASGSDLRLRLDDIGGIRCRVLDLGSALTYSAWGAKLEIGPAATGDATNYGARTT